MKLFIKTNVIFVIAFFISCSSSGTSDNSGNKNNQTTEKVTQSGEPATPSSGSNEGQNLFLKYCMACHQTDGSGVPGMYPPLINSPIVNSGNKNDFIKVLLNGLKGPIEVHGQKYNQQMPKQDFLSDEDLSRIINYVSRSFQNHGSEVKPSDIKALRNNSSN